MILQTKLQDHFELGAKDQRNPRQQAILLHLCYTITRSFHIHHYTMFFWSLAPYSKWSCNFTCNIIITWEFWIRSKGAEEPHYIERKKIIWYEIISSIASWREYTFFSNQTLVENIVSYYIVAFAMLTIVRIIRFTVSLSLFLAIQRHQNCYLYTSMLMLLSFDWTDTHE